jgi:hypothetical protein
MPLALSLVFRPRVKEARIATYIDAPCKKAAHSGPGGEQSLKDRYSAATFGKCASEASRAAGS